MYRSKNQGFTLIELAIVLVVIGLILGALSIGSNLQRSAEYTKINSRFVTGWVLAYNEYFARAGVVLGDDFANPTGRVNQAQGSQICGATLQGFMDTQGVDMPPGRAEGQEDKYVYLDSNGNPQYIEVCFENILWYDATGATSSENVMVLKGLSPNLAQTIDVTTDTRADARFGKVRDTTLHSTGTASLAWSKDNRTQYGTTNTRNYDEDQVVIVDAYYKMDQ